MIINYCKLKPQKIGKIRQYLTGWGGVFGPQSSLHLFFPLPKNTPRRGLFLHSEKIQIFNAIKVNNYAEIIP